MSFAVHVEVLISEDARNPNPPLTKNLITTLLLDRLPYFCQGSIVDPENNGGLILGLPPKLRQSPHCVKDVVICDFPPEAGPIIRPWELYQFVFHQYVFSEDESEDIIIGGEDDDDDSSETVEACHHWVLPHRLFSGMWEYLLFDSTIKSNLLSYMETSLLFHDRKVNSNIVDWNKVVLLYGPPGTGKSSLCIALAQKMTIRLSNRFAYGHFVEVNAHSLFSKWFSESGKLVTRLFTRLRELVEEEDAIVFILIDEVESLAVARDSAIKGAEPSDSIRGVNAFITQLDLLAKQYSNVCILTTSNLQKAVDLAFLSRVDMKHYIGYPSESVRYMIVRNGLKEMMRVGIVESTNLPDTLIDCAIETTAGRRTKKDESAMSVDEGAGEVTDRETRTHRRNLRILQKVIEECDGLSGRMLKKLPLLTHVHCASCCLREDAIPFRKFLQAMLATVEKIQRNEDRL